MNRTICKALMFLFLFGGVTCVFFVRTSQQPMQDDIPRDHYRVYINDVATDCYAKYTSDSPYIMLPFLALVESLGETVTWQSETKAFLSFANNTWEFDVEYVSLRPLRSNSNIICPPPGSTEGIHTEQTERDAYVDSRSLEHILRNYFDAKIVEIDKENRVVRINLNEK